MTITSILRIALPLVVSILSDLGLLRKYQESRLDGVSLFSYWRSLFQSP